MPLGQGRHHRPGRNDHRTQTVSLVMHPEGAVSGDETRSGSAIISARSSANAKGAMVSQSFTVQGSGAITIGAVV